MTTVVFAPFTYGLVRAQLLQFALLKAIEQQP